MTQAPLLNIYTLLIYFKEEQAAKEVILIQYQTGGYDQQREEKTCNLINTYKTDSKIVFRMVNNQQRSTDSVPRGYRETLLLPESHRNVDYSDIIKKNEDITRLIQRAAVLPLVPPHLVEDVWFTTLEDIGEADNIPATPSFTDYVTEFWVEG
ncbi:unnamed protein product [Mytilus coruscus]|uniref:Uncharacterized protein n=1 Tax=Mytilus coruscus TaxID=42192 RepID=A0A6J8B6X0_MYTCO|nr:unnamed protein product [Mytilus coruscus]